MDKIPIRDSGLILFVTDYPRSVAFYRDQVGLPVRFDKENLTCFQFGASYLLVEPLWGERNLTPPGDNSPVLRLNVKSIDETLEALRARGVTAEKMEFDWGMIGQLKDPDGYTVEFCQWPEDIYRDHPPMV